MPVKKIKTKKPDTSWKLTTVPIHSWILFWTLVLTTMTLAFVCFNSAFPQPIETESGDATLAMFQTVKSNLERQVEELQGRVESMEATEPTPSVDCPVTNPGPADSHVLYIEPQTSVSMLLPYSTRWGESGCIPAPIAAVDYPQKIAFGPSTAGEGDAARDSTLAIDKTTNTSEARKMLDQQKKDTEYPITNLRERNINGLTVFSYGATWGLGGKANEWFALGKTHAYKITSHGWLTDAEAVKIIQSLRVVK